MTESEILPPLTEIFHDLFFDDTIVVTPQLTADDVKGWDSIKHINLIVAVEDRFGIEFKSSEIEGLANVGDLIRLIEARA
jgi:acyl carrier protein